MRNPVVLAARLAGRPLLMRPEAAAMYGARLVAMDPTRGKLQFERPRSAFSAFIERVRGAKVEAPEAPEAAPPGPSAYWPMWLEQAAGQPDDEGFGWALSDGIALVEIAGPLLDEGWACDGEVWINGYDTLSATFAEIAADPRVKGCWIKHDSPGGVACDGILALAAQLRALRAQMPVWSFCELSCSADYWLAANTGRVLASRLAIVGSIGAVITHCGMAGMLEKDGIEVEYIQFGAKKTDGSPFKPLSAGARADLQAEIDELGTLFVADVVAGRPGLTAEGVLATQAGVFLGQHSDPERSALALGLIDAVATEPEAFQALRDLVAGVQVPVRAPLAPSPAAPAAQTPKEKTMKRSALLAAAERAGLSAEDRERLLAQAAQEDGYEEDGEPEDVMVDEEPDMASGGEQPAETPAEEAEEEAEGEDEVETPDEPEATGEAAAISASELATKHPAHALAAIRSGMTFAQFEASVEAAQASAGAQPTRLQNQMSGARRLGADAAPVKTMTPAAAINPSAIYARRNAKPGRASTKH